MKTKVVTVRLSQKALAALAKIRTWHEKSGVKISQRQAIESALIKHCEAIDENKTNQDTTP